MVDVLLASDAEHADDLGGEREPLVAALADVGLRADVAVWDDPAVDWGGARMVVVRTVWDSHRRRDEVLAWARSVVLTGADLRNPPHVLADSSHKTYLRRLSAAGVPVVPTRWPTGPVDAAELAASLGEDLVVKPAVSAGAERTVRAGPASAAAAVGALLAAGDTPMVQPYLRSVEDPGETKVVVLGGRVSHAVRTNPMLVPEPGSPDAHEAREPSAEELAVVEQVLAACGYRDELLYARVDVVRGDDGAVLLGELEAVEPLLFLYAHPDAPARLAAAVAERL